ncbi:MaoC family dehydratase [Aquamicrobium zhengzhouense]|uniref:MaoC family dehydratase n=1 Tax=Aquamicrobium zhengzhouense TaxID=2781738 RepID=A0ABS0S9H1_9HYPH|nr:MaoC family dehydratase [Aquamicrobium zhengzhouense]MBI1619934.1 MaoC family dehydratase [Aquamicrobium zhengzhouense]
MTEKRWAFEDFQEGMTLQLGEKLVTAQEIIEFASEFDAQPMHLDEDAGKASILGGLAASGWHSCAMLMRMMCDAFLLDSTSQGAPGIDYVRWMRPVLAGDTIKVRTTVLATRSSTSRPDLGFVTVRHEMSNQKSEIVMQVKHTGMFLKREVAA